MSGQESSLLLPLLVNGVVIGMLYGVVAMCFVLIYKASQVVNFAQGEMLLVGAWVCWWLLTRHHVPFIWGFLITLGFMMLLGILIQMVMLRPMVGEPIISVIMVTVGLSIFLQALMKWIFGVFAQPFPPVFPAKTVQILGLTMETAYAMSASVCIVVMLAFAWFFKFSRTGLAMRATAFSQQVAQSLGIPVGRIFALSWGISAMVSAVAGVVIGVVNGVSSALSFYGVKVFPAAIVGGLDSIVGAVLGGLVIGVVENVAQFADARFLHVGNLYEVAPFYVLILILLIRPYGLLGTRDIERV